MASDTRPKRYFALHYTLLRFLGLGWWHHPDEGDTRNFQGWYLYYSIVTQLVWVVGFVGLETIDPFIGEKDIDRFMFSLSFVITHDLTLIKLYIFYFKNNEIQDIVRTLEIDLYDYYQNNKKNNATVRITKILTSSFLFFGWITIGNTNVYGTIQDLRWKAEVLGLNDTALKPPRTLPQPIWIPWKYQTDRAYISTFVLETVGLLWTGHIVMTIDTFIGSVILHMSSQFAILREALETAYDRTIKKLHDARQDVQEPIIPSEEELVGDEETQNTLEAIVWERYSAKEIESALDETFRNCFRQHQVLIEDILQYFVRRFVFVSKNIAADFGINIFMILQTMQKIEPKGIMTRGTPTIDFLKCVEKFAATYSYGFMTQLLSSMAAICVVMVQVSQDASSFKSIRLVTSLAFFMAMIIQLAIQCFTGNELTLQASRIADGVMQSKWDRMPPRLRRHLVLVMMRAQRPLRLSAAGFAYMNNDCFLAIMKAAYSYYAVLSQKQNNI